MCCSTQSGFPQDISCCSSVVRTASTRLCVFPTTSDHDPDETIVGLWWAPLPDLDQGISLLLDRWVGCAGGGCYSVIHDIPQVLVWIQVLKWEGGGTV